MRCAGVGWSMLALSGVACLTANTLLSWVLHYCAASARALGALVVAPHDAELPWTHCNHSWNTPRCADSRPDDVQVSHVTCTPDADSRVL